MLVFVNGAVCSSPASSNSEAERHYGFLLSQLSHISSWMGSFFGYLVVRNKELTTLQSWHDPHISILWKHDQIFDTQKDSWFLTNFTNLTNITGLPSPFRKLKSLSLPHMGNRKGHRWSALDARSNIASKWPPRAAWSLGLFKLAKARKCCKLCSNIHFSIFIALTLDF